MTGIAQMSGRGPTRRGLRIRGVAVLVSIALGTAAVWRMAEPAHPDRITFELIAAEVGDGVGTNTAVRLRGLSVGSVTRVEPHGPGRQLISLSVDRAPAGELTTAMQTRVVSANVFGATAVELIPKSGGSPVTPQTVLDMGDTVGNYTVTSVLRDSGRAVMDVITPKLGVSLDSAAQLTASMGPMLASALLVLRTVSRAQQMPVSELLPKLASVTAGATAVTPSALSILDTLASVEELDSDEQAQLASDTITEVSNLVFAFSGRFVGALAPMSHAVDMILDSLIPLNQGMRNVTPDQVRRLIAGTDGALQHRAEAVVLQTDLLIEAFPAFRVPLQLTPGSPR